MNTSTGERFLDETWSIVTVTYNSALALRSHWFEYPPDNVEWIVVDNNSSDDSIAVAREHGATCILTQSMNRGFGAASNIGLKQASGRFVAFVNPDVTIDFCTLSALSRILESEDTLIGPQLVYPDGTLQPNGRGLPTLWNKVANRLSVAKTENKYYKFAHPGEEKYVCWLIGAAVCGLRQTLVRLGGWDERYFIYYEDSALGLRAWQMGVPVKLVGSARWIHGWARETTSFRVAPWKRELSSMVKFYSRHPDMLGRGSGFEKQMQRLDSTIQFH